MDREGTTTKAADAARAADSHVLWEIPIAVARVDAWVDVSSVNEVFSPENKAKQLQLCYHVNLWSQNLAQTAAGQKLDRTERKKSQGSGTHLFIRAPDMLNSKPRATRQRIASGSRRAGRASAVPSPIPWALSLTQFALVVATSKRFTTAAF